LVSDQILTNGSEPVKMAPEREKACSIQKTPIFRIISIRLCVDEW